MDKDIFIFVFVTLFVGIAYVINVFALKFRMSFRRWVGLIMVDIGAASIFIKLPNSPESIIATLFYIIGGLCLWFIKPQKIKSRRK